MKSDYYLLNARCTEPHLYSHFSCDYILCGLSLRVCSKRALTDMKPED